MDNFLFWMRMILLVSIWMTCSSCYNALSGTSNTKTDPALYEDGMKALNSLDYDTAIAKFEAIGVDYASQTEVKMNYAGALAGKCGFNFINYFNKLGVSPSGSTFLFFMNQWKTTSTSANAMYYSTKRQYCVQSETVVKSIHPSVSGRDSSQSLFLFLLGLAKIGIYLKETADPNGTGTGQWPIVTPNTDGACLEANLPATAVKEIIAGLGMAFLNLTNIATILSGANIDTSAVTAVCASITPNPCSFENSSEVTDTTVIKAMRSLLNVSATGVVNGAICL